MMRRNIFGQIVDQAIKQLESKERQKKIDAVLLAYRIGGWRWLASTKLN